MKNRYFCRSPYLNVYESATTKSNLSSQILYGEKFQIIQKKKKFLKIRTSYDKYVGFIKVRKFNKKMNQTHKVSVLKSKIYSRRLLIALKDFPDVDRKSKRQLGSVTL